MIFLIRKFVKYLLVALFTTFILPVSASETDIIIVTNRMMLDAKQELIKQSAHQAGVKVQFVSTTVADKALLETLQQSNFVLVDLPREMDMQSFSGRLQDLQPPTSTPLMLISRNTFQAKNIAMAASQQLHDYYRNGGRKNMEVFFTAVSSLLTGKSLVNLPKPQLLPQQGAYHPRYSEGYSADPDAVLVAVDADRTHPVIAIGFHVRYLESDAMAHIDELVKKVESRGANALPVFYSLGPDSRLPELLKDRADVLIHLQPVYHNGLKTQLDTLGIPVIQGIGWWQDSIESWEQSPSGLPLQSTPLYLALPEQNGLIDPMVLWAEQDDGLKLIDYQVDATIDKAIRLAHLQNKPLEQQKLAVMVYNYPPGQENLSASFMNVPRSLAVLSEQWVREGYNTNVLTEQQLIDGLGSSIKATHQEHQPLDKTTGQILSLESYLTWFEQLPQPVQNRINDYWGKPQDSSMLTQLDDQPVFVIPHVAAGNIIYLGQPPRGLPGMDNEKSLYHDMRVPVNHYYLATYLWVQENFQADALVHFGTHGTQEWMPGKERGLSIFDDPYLALGNIPVVYPYIIDNVGEATQAKRRGRAVMISHQTPPFRPSGLHGKLVDIHQLIHQWENLEPGEVRDNTVASLLDLSLSDNLTTDLGWDVEQVNQTPELFIQQLHDYLHELAAQSQPIGLHTFAAQDIEEQKLTTVLQMLGNEFIDAFNLADQEELFAKDYQALSQTLPYQWLQAVVSKSEPIKPELAKWQQKALDYYASLTAEYEWESFNSALQGNHIEPGIGGDPIRVPESLPSGKNLVGFDPARIPTKEAWLAGKKAIDELISSHQQEKGTYPRRLAFSLWAVEAMRHGGILESQALYAMGVEPTWDDGGRVNGFNIIEQQQLQRPRVDVVLSATGLYRDQFPNVMEVLAQAAAAVTELDEKDNPVYQHTQQLLADLRGKGIAEDKAKIMAQTRVFGSPTGVYGTGLEDASLASDTWESDDKLAKLYLDRMSHAFGPDSSQWGKEPDYSELYAENLKTVDAALLARTSNLYGMLTTDDPFQYLGGIDLAVRHLTGKSPELYISNQREQGKVRFQSAAEFLAVEMATRSFHPGWIEAMKEEGFAGALNLQDMTNNLWGWQTVSPDVVKDHQWQKMHDIYVMDSLDLDLNEWFENYSPEAQLRMMERMLDAIRKNYWDASEQTRKELVAAYIQSLQEHDLQPAHAKLADFADNQARGFGLAPIAEMPPAPDQQQSPEPKQPPQTDMAQAQQVEGQKLEKTSQEGIELETQWWWLSMLIIPLLTGALRQYNVIRKAQ
ncbi:cobaltochelatase subunit CobN [Methylophaga nitratireducenticrescens]|uniref:CobN-like chelatase BtuS for metalloporphyrine salvage n=1 Tax=Methylophaga nitratireducenticrescens TaxID=754476 RepID=I1XH25_METNJ|nr:cobaltochelatase subunit CobN [Methylophaga nitratireducenticrescens]